MSFYKFIYWRSDIGEKNGKHFANIHLLIGRDCSITDYQEAAEEMRKTFPQATNDELTCSRVYQSRQFKGFSILRFNDYIEKKDYEHWIDTRSIPEYESV